MGRENHNCISLDHVEDRLVLMEPDVVVGDGHILEGDLLGVLEVRVRLPDVIKPGDGQRSVDGAHVAREPQTVVHPALREENVGRVRLKRG